MSSTFSNWSRGERELDLLVGRATQGLSEAELQELRQSGADEELSFDLAAAAADLAMIDQVEPMPASCRAKLEHAARTFCASQRPPVVEVVGSERRDGVAGRIDSERRISMGWVAAAAGILLAVLAWLPKLSVSSTGGGTPPLAATPAERRAVLLAEATDKGVWSWSDFKHPETQADPEIKGVRGDVVWSGERQEGYMRFEGLPPNNPANERYQLWIIDERGLSQRVSGGLFDVHAQGETIVPIRPAVPIGTPAIFAVTIEKPLGVAVSDMSRRACAAIAVR